MQEKINLNTFHSGTMIVFGFKSNTLNLSIVGLHHMDIGMEHIYTIAIKLSIFHLITPLRF